MTQSNGLSQSKNSLSLYFSTFNSQKFVTSNIIGATNLKQLKSNIDSYKIELSKDLVEEIDKIHDENPYPCP